MTKYVYVAKLPRILAQDFLESFHELDLSHNGSVTSSPFPGDESVRTTRLIEVFFNDSVVADFFELVMTSGYLSNREYSTLFVAVPVSTT